MGYFSRGVSVQLLDWIERRETQQQSASLGSLKIIKGMHSNGAEAHAMTPLFKKLNLKAQTDLLVVNPPPSFTAELSALTGVTIHHNVDSLAVIEFSLAFVTQQQDVDNLAAAIGPRVQGDGLVWFAYPKRSSKHYTDDINRDTGWAALGQLGFEPVRQVAIDTDWSALRFRRVEFIKTMTRDPKRSISGAGQAKATQP